VKPARASAWMVPSSCHGVVFAAGNGKCQEMLSLRIVVLPGASARLTPASSTRRSMSERMDRRNAEDRDRRLHITSAATCVFSTTESSSRVLLDDRQHAV
jgi:hypothetical protein